MHSLFFLRNPPCHAFFVGERQQETVVAIEHTPDLLNIFLDENNIHYVLPSLLQLKKEIFGLKDKMENVSFFSVDPGRVDLPKDHECPEKEEATCQTWNAVKPYLKACFGILLAGAAFSGMFIVSIFFSSAIPVFFVLLFSPHLLAMIGFGLLIASLGVLEIVYSPTEPEEVEPKKVIKQLKYHVSDNPRAFDVIGKQLERHAFYVEKNDYFKLTKQGFLEDKKIFIMIDNTMLHFLLDVDKNRRFIIGAISPDDKVINHFSLEFKQDSCHLQPVKVLFNYFSEQDSPIIFSYTPEAETNRKFTHLPDGDQAQQDALLQVLATAYFMTCYEDETKRRKGYENAYEMTWDSVFSPQDPIMPAYSNVKRAKR